MALYRKLPIVIEAVQLRWDTWSEICDFADVGKLSDGKCEGCYVDDEGNGTFEPCGDQIAMWIPTLEGVMLAKAGDFIIKGVQGELYACKPDIFRKTYEEVVPQPLSSAYNPPAETPFSKPGEGLCCEQILGPAPLSWVERKLTEYDRGFDPRSSTTESEANKE